MPLDETTNPTIDPAIHKAVADLLADHERQEGLSQEDVERVLAGRGIMGAGGLAVYEKLSQHGIDIRQTAEAPTPTVRRRARHVRRALAEEPALRGMLSHATLSDQEEIVLGRRIAQAQRTRADLNAGLVDDGPAARHVLRLGAEASERFVRSNLRLVLSVAQRYLRPGGLPLADLLQEGTIGLMRAVELFDHTRGYKFSTYATWWIRHAITRSIGDKADTIRIPIHLGEAVRKLRRAERRLVLTDPRPPTVSELADELDWCIERVVKVLAASDLGIVSMDSARDDDNAGTLLDLIASSDQNPEEAAVWRDLVIALRETLSHLSDRQRLVLGKRFGLLDGNEHTLQDIGTEFGLTRERIRQIEAKALTRLRHPVHSKRYRVFVGLA